MNLLQTLLSVLAAFLGVQTEQNRKRDFQHGSAKSFIILGILATILFVMIINYIVKFILNTVGH